jgi:hypothetical protein
LWHPKNIETAILFNLLIKVWHTRNSLFDVISIGKFLLCVNQKMITRFGLAACPDRELGQATADDLTFWVYDRKFRTGNQKGGYCFRKQLDRRHYKF